MKDCSCPARLKENIKKVLSNSESYAPSDLFELCSIADNSRQQNAAERDYDVSSPSEYDQSNVLQFLENLTAEQNIFLNSL